MRAIVMSMLGMAVAFAANAAGEGGAPGKAAAPAAKPAAAAAPAPAPAAPTAAAAAAPAAIDWKAMKKPERKKYMKEVVMPKMKELFMTVDAKKYSAADCTLCHKSTDNFKMPNPKLPKLPGDEAGFKALAEKKPEVVQFMATKVKPAMAALLNLPEYNPETKQGVVGCPSCHTMEKPKK
jgi:hypothetical protein